MNAGPYAGGPLPHRAIDHPCIFEAQPEPTDPELYRVRCRCHEQAHLLRRATDLPHTCPVTGRRAPADLPQAAGVR